MKVKFWIKSSRGTDQFEIQELPDDLTESEVVLELEAWCSLHGAWHVSDNLVKYGWEPVDDAEIG